LLGVRGNHTEGNGDRNGICAHKHTHTIHTIIKYTPERYTSTHARTHRGSLRWGGGWRVAPVSLEDEGRPRGGEEATQQGRRDRGLPFRGDPIPLPFTTHRDFHNKFRALQSPPPNPKSLSSPPPPPLTSWRPPRTLPHPSTFQKGSVCFGGGCLVCQSYDHQLFPICMNPVIEEFLGKPLFGFFQGTTSPPPFSSRALSPEEGPGPASRGARGDPPASGARVAAGNADHDRLALQGGPQGMAPSGVIQPPSKLPLGDTKPPGGERSRLRVGDHF